MSFSNITNIYELLDQDGEEGVARLPPKKEVAAPKPAAPATKTASPAVKSAQQSSYNRTQSPKGERRNDQRRDNNRPPRQDRPRPQQQDQQGETERQPVESARRDRPVDRNNAQDKGASRNEEYRRNAGAAGFVGNTNKRVFDRKSQNNRGDGQGRENKRGGRGKNNWGAADGSDIVDQAIKDVAKATGENILQGEGVADNKGTDAAAEKLEEQTPKEETEDEKKAREQREKEEKQVSWSDYQKQLAEKKAQSALPSASAQRKANEGIDEKTAKKWSSYEQVKRDDVVSAKAEEKKADAKTDAKKKQTVRLDELFTIKETPKPAYTTEDRGGKKGGKYDNTKKQSGGNRGKQSSGQTTQPGAAEVSFDATSFPVLQ